MNTKLSIEDTENPNQAAPPSSPAPIATPASPPIRNPKSAIRNRPLRHSRSNIARLPYLAREMLNHALREGMDYRLIIARVENMTSKAHGVTKHNLSKWYQTGYVEWLRQKTHLEDTIA